jgi:hypothetical protein
MVSGEPNTARNGSSVVVYCSQVIPRVSVIMAKLGQTFFDRAVDGRGGGLKEKIPRVLHCTLVVLTKYNTRTLSRGSRMNFPNWRS